MEYSHRSLIYAHCVHRKKKRKNKRDRKDMRGIKYTYYRVATNSGNFKVEENIREF